MRRLAVLPGTAVLAGTAALALTLLAGCQIFIVREPAPEGFRTTACRAYESLVMADQALGKREPRMAGSFLDEADGWLADLPVWDPGAQLVVELHALAEVPGGAVLRKAALFRVDREYKALADTHGFTCEWRYADWQWPSPSPP